MRKFDRIRLGRRMRAKEGGEFLIKPDEIMSMLRAALRETMGDAVENRATVTASRGYFFVKLPRGTGTQNIRDDYWRQALRSGVHLRRHSLGLFLRALHGEVLTEA